METSISRRVSLTIFRYSSVERFVSYTHTHARAFSLTGRYRLSECFYFDSVSTSAVREFLTLANFFSLPSFRSLPFNVPFFLEYSATFLTPVYALLKKSWTSRWIARLIYTRKTNDSSERRVLLYSEKETRKRERKYNNWKLPLIIAAGEEKKNKIRFESLKSIVSRVSSW